MSPLWLLLLLTSLQSTSASFAKTPTSIKELKDELKRTQEGGGCFKILTRDAEYGCDRGSSTPSRAPLQFLTDVHETIESDRALVMHLSSLPAFVERTELDIDLQNRIAIVLILLPKDGTETAFSAGDRFPNALFPNGTFPYEDRSHRWNPEGTGLRYKRLPFPVFLLDATMEQHIINAAQTNKQQGFSGALFHVESDMSMSAKGNSVSCLEAGYCLPIGGHSVLGFLPSLTRPTPDKDTLLVMSSIDSAGFFLDSITGADASLSGLLTLLTVSEILSKTDRDDYRRRVMFAALSGEPWDYMGSRRMIRELIPGDESVFGDRVPIDLSSISQIVEIGQIGKATKREDLTEYYLHPSRGSGEDLAVAFEEAAGRQEKVRLRRASERLPGLPPSSLMTWLSVNASIQGLVLTEYDDRYLNAQFESVLDTEIDPESIVRASVVVASAVYQLTTGASDLEVDEENVRRTVDQLISCLVMTSPGLNCDLARNLISINSHSSLGRSQAEHYLSVLRSVDDRTQASDIDVKKNIERFVFNFLGERLSDDDRSLDRCDLDDRHCDADGQVCIGYRSLAQADRLGRCLQSSVYYIPSYSLSLQYIPCRGRTTPCGWKMTDDEGKETDDYWHPDRIWTESNWPHTPRFHIYIVESSSTEIGILMGGITSTVLCIVVSLIVKGMYNKRARRAD